MDVIYRCFRRCGYCEYRTNGGGLTPWEEVDRQLEAAARHRCREVLIMSGEQLWRLPDLGLAGEPEFVERVIETCQRAMARGLLPHTHVGLLSRGSLERLRPWNASMGLMLETGTARILAHAMGGGKRFRDRLRHLDGAGELAIPFTTGILVGIGEEAADRRTALEAIAASHLRHGHIQEVIVQNFVPKPGTPTADHAPPTLEVVRGAVELARAILPDAVTIQTPPNLNLDHWP